MMTIGQRIRKIREQQGLTQKKLAELAGLTRTSLGRIERGQTTQVRADSLGRLAATLGVSTDHLGGRSASGGDLERHERLIKDVMAQVDERISELVSKMADSPSTSELVRELMGFISEVRDHARALDDAVSTLHRTVTDEIARLSQLVAGVDDELTHLKEGVDQKLGKLSQAAAEGITSVSRASDEKYDQVRQQAAGLAIEIDGVRQAVSSIRKELDGIRNPHGST